MTEPIIKDIKVEEIAKLYRIKVIHNNKIIFTDYIEDIDNISMRIIKI